MKQINEMNDYQLLLLIKEKFGNEINCDELIQKKYGHKFICPECGGKGYIVKEYNDYPSGLPDSGCVYEPAYRNIKCEVCDGAGFTDVELVPNMVQQGWKPKN